MTDPREVALHVAKFSGFVRHAMGGGESSRLPASVRDELLRSRDGDQWSGGRVLPSAQDRFEEVAAQSRHHPHVQLVLHVPSVPSRGEHSGLAQGLQMA